MGRRPPRSTRTDTLFPYTTLFRSVVVVLVGAFALAQLVPYGWERPNPPVVQDAPWPAAAAASLARSSCYDCHSNEVRSEEHTSELQSLMRISYAVFCLKKKTQHKYYVPLTN